MSENHHIGELLLAGATPSKEEAAHLSDLGAFVASMYGRYLHGLTPAETLASGTDSFASRLSGRLGATTGTRWEAGLGLSEHLLGDAWSSWWQIASGGFSHGYYGLDPDMASLTLYEEEADRIAAPASRPAPRRRGSLFGRRAAPVRRRKGTPGRPITKASPSREGKLAWSDGGLVQVSAVEAMARGGLDVVDQLALPAPAADAGRVASRRRRRAILDGLAIDDRTPALSSALFWAEAAFSPAPMGGAGLSITGERLSRITAAAPAIDPGWGAGRRPVLSFFDAVEGDFLALTPEVGAPKAGTKAASWAAASPASPRPSLFASDRQQAAAPERRGLAPAPIVTSGLAAAPIVTSIDRVAAPARRAANAVRPYISGVFPAPAPAGFAAAAAARSLDVADVTPAAARASNLGAPEALRLATSVTYTRGGQPQARVQRSGVSAPRVALASVAPASARRGVPASAMSGAVPVLGGMSVAGGGGWEREVLTAPAAMDAAAIGSSTWRLEADLGADLPLGATFTAPEVVGATVAAQAAPRALATRAPFMPVVARDLGRPKSGAVSSRAFGGALDGLIWVTPEGDAESPATVLASGEGLPLAAVPSGRAAAMVPAATALEAIGRSATRSEAARVAASGVPPHQALTLAAGAERVESPPGTSVLRPGAAVDAGEAPRQRQLVAALERRLVESLRSGVLRRVSARDRVPAAPLAVGAVGARRERAIASAPGRRELVDVVSRWLRDEVGLSGEALASGRREASVGAGAYISFDEDRQLLGLVDPRPEATPAARRERAVTARPSLFAQRSSAPHANTVTPVSPAGSTGVDLIAAIASGTFASVSGLEAAGPAPAATRRAQAARGTVRQLAQARHALRRPVVTPRETRVVSRALAGVGRRGQALVAMTGRVEPTLARRIGRRNDERGAVAAASSSWGAGAEALQALGRLAPTDSPAIMQTLRSAGWSEAELRMLDIAGPDAVDAVAARSAPATALEARRVQRALAKAGLVADPSVTGPTAARPAAVALARAEAAPGVLAAAVAAEALAPAEVTGLGSRATAMRMGKGLARVLAGAEGLGGATVADRAGVGEASLVASGQASGFMPMLAATMGDRYFGAAAPERRVAGLGGLRDAIGELVAIAREQAATADSPVASVAHREALRRIVDAQRTTSRAQPQGRAARAVNAELSELGATESVAAERVRAVLSDAGVSVTPQNLATVGATFARTPSLAQGVDETLLAMLEAAGVPVTSVDATTIGAASEVPAPTLASLLATSEQALVGLTESPAPSEGAAAAGRVATRRARGRGGLGARLSRAIRASTMGPAGARRLLQPVEARAQSAAADGAMRAIGSLTRGGIEAGTPTTVDSVLAPEAMLTGLRSVEIKDALEAAGSARAAWRGEAPGVFATMADSGVELGGLVAGVRRGAEGGRGTRRGAEGGRGASRAGTAPVRPTQSRSLFKSDPVQVLLSLVSGGDAARVGAASLERALAGGTSGGVGRSGRARLLSTILRGAERREMASLFQQAGASDFAFAWLGRVDGSRSGLALGFDGTRRDIGRAFGAPRRMSRVAGASPIGEAGLVSPRRTREPGEDRSGLRRLSRHVETSRAGSARAQHAAGAALRRTDWRYVETGSRASTTHADLGKLASAIASSAAASSRAPMPLVAPAVKAVAQTALRSAKTESTASSRSGGGKGESGEGGASAEAQKISEQAMDQLAIEVASRVARIMGRDKERIGIWQ